MIVFEIRSNCCAKLENEISGDGRQFKRRDEWEPSITRLEMKNIRAAIRRPPRISPRESLSALIRSGRSGFLRDNRERDAGRCWTHTARRKSISQPGSWRFSD